MWIFTKTGFISCVQHREKPDTMIVRARKLEHLAAFVGKQHAAEIFTLDFSDYKYRIELSRAIFQELVANQVEQLDYPNFKNSISDSEHDYRQACGATWEVCYHAFKSND